MPLLGYYSIDDVLVSCLAYSLFFSSRSISISYSSLKLASYVSRLNKGPVSFTSLPLWFYFQTYLVSLRADILWIYSHFHWPFVLLLLHSFFSLCVLNWTSVACHATPPAFHIVATWYESVFSLLGMYSFWTLSYGGFYYLKENYLEFDMSKTFLLCLYKWFFW